MGLLDALRGKKPKLTVTVDPAEARPGDEVTVRVVVEGELDDKAESGRAGIRCVNDYLKREYDREDEEWDEVWRAVTLHEDFGDLPLAAGEHELRFTIPEGLPPASEHAVGWWAYASIARRRGLDASASTRIGVPLPAPAGTPERRTHAPGEDGVGLVDVAEWVRAGETLDGAVSVTAPDDVKASGVRAELRKVRTYTADGHSIVRRDDAAEAELSGSLELAAGQTQQFSFALPVPADAAPSARAPHTLVEWRVRAVVARRMRPDLVLEVPVTVYDA